MGTASQTHSIGLRRGFGPLLVVFGLGVACLGAAATTPTDPGGRVVSQKGRNFQPNALTLHRNDTITIVNDDSDLLHHAYIESSAFSFDSGDQLPGSHTSVTFTKSGVFQVQCGIHPKMKLTVRVD